VVCFSDPYREEIDGAEQDTVYRLLMLFGNSVSNKLNNKTRDIIQGVDINDESLKEWPVSIGPFNLDLNKLAPNFGKGGSGLNVELYTEDKKEEQEKGYGLNYLDGNGFYMQTPFVGKTSLTEPALPDGSPILPCGQQRTWYGNLKDPYPRPDPSAFHVDFSRGFDCGQGFPEYEVSDSPDNLLGAGYSYGYGYGGAKINQDLRFITIINAL